MRPDTLGAAASVDRADKKNATVSGAAMSFLSHLESTADGSAWSADSLRNVHRGKPLLARYDLEALAARVRRDVVAGRPPDMWRYRELLPLPDHMRPVSLGETTTPLLACPRLGARLGARDLWIKDESRLPTGSFKARGMAMAVSMARALGARRLAVPTQGNAGVALAAYAARAGLACDVFLPADTPPVYRIDVQRYGGAAHLVDGLIHDCAALVREGAERGDWFDLSTLREPYRVEGKKTMGLELAEQLGWRLPDVVLYPTGGGTGLIGMHKAFAELAAIGWLEDDRRPRLIACQSDGCAPIVAAFERGLDHAEPWSDPRTTANGLRVPRALGDFLILRAVRESGGFARAADETRLPDLARLARTLEGIDLCLEAATCLDVLRSSLADGALAPDARIVVFNTGKGPVSPNGPSSADRV